MSHPLPDGGEQRSVYITNEMWAAAKRARAMVTIRSDREPSLSELVRWGLYRQLRAIRDGDYDPPAGYDATIKPGRKKGGR